MLEPAAGEQHVRLDQRLDDGVVGVALLTLVGDNLFAFKARGVCRETAIGADGEGNGGVDAARFEVAGAVHPDVEVLAAMAGGGVHEACTGIVGHVVAVEQRHVEVVSLAAQRVGAGHGTKFGSGHIGKPLVLELGLGE